MWTSIKLLVCAVLVLNAAAQTDTLTAKLRLADLQYCRNRGSSVTLLAQVDVTYENGTQDTILLPRFARVSGYRLYLSESQFRAGHLLASVRYKLAPMLDTSKLDASTPNPQLFDTLRAGESVNLRGEFFIGLTSAVTRKLSSDQDQYVVLHIDPWPDTRRNADRLKNLWSASGRLWIDKLESAPLVIHILNPPPARVCVGTVD